MNREHRGFGLVGVVMDWSNVVDQWNQIDRSKGGVRPRRGVRRVRSRATRKPKPSCRAAAAECAGEEEEEEGFMWIAFGGMGSHAHVNHLSIHIHKRRPLVVVGAGGLGLR